MKKLFYLLFLIPITGNAQIFTKINGQLTGFTQGVNNPTITIKTQDGHIWFNSLVNSRYRLYEFDGTKYSYHPSYYDSSVSGLRDIHATYFAQANDGVIYVQSGQHYKDSKWVQNKFTQTLMCQSQDKSTLYFYSKNLDSIYSLSNGSFVGNPLNLGQIKGLTYPNGNLNYEDAVADNNGNLYFATPDSSVIKVNINTQQVTYMPVMHDGDILRRPTCLHVASNGHIYVGSSLEGYFAYHNGSEWTLILQIPKFYDWDKVKDFAEDEHGRVWIASTAYIARFDENDQTQLFDIIQDTTSNREYISNRNLQALLIENDSVFYFGVYQESYLLKAEIKSSPTSSIHKQTISTLNAYPNPVDDVLHIKGIKNGLADVYDFLGRKVISLNIENNKIDLSSLAQGVYLLRVETDNKTYQMKLTKK